MILHLQGQGQRVSWSLEHTMLVPGMNTKEIMHCPSLNWSQTGFGLALCIYCLTSHILSFAFLFLCLSRSFHDGPHWWRLRQAFAPCVFAFAKTLSLYILVLNAAQIASSVGLYLISRPSWKSCMSRTCNHKTKTLGGKPTQSVGKLAQSERMWKVVYAQVCLELLTRKKSKKPERLRKKYHGCIRKMLTQLSQSWKFEVLAYAPWFQFHFFMAI